MVEVLAIDNTDSTPVTVGSAETTIRTVQFKPNSYNNVRISFTLVITTTSSSLTNTVSIRLRDATNLINVWQYKTDPIARINNYTYEYITAGAAVNDSVALGGPLTITCQASGADVNTTIGTTNVYVTSLD